MIEAVAFDFQERQVGDVPWREIRSAMERGCFCWVDIDCSKCPEGCQASAECKECLQLAGLNEMALAEVLGADREGRYDVYEDCLHFAVSEARLDDGRLVTAHVDVVLSARCMITFRRHDALFLKHLKRTYREDFLKFARSSGFLLYEIGDHLIEIYRRTLRVFSEVVEKTQLRLFGEVNDEIFRQVADLTQDILVFRKVILASRELFHELASRKSPFVSESTQPFLESMAGTLERLSSDLATDREVLNETLNLYMGMVSHRTNKVVNRLTVISVIFLPLSFLCGVYGMNLPGMPETQWDQSYKAFWLVVVIITGISVYFMRRSKWL